MKKKLLFGCLILLIMTLFPVSAAAGSPSPMTVTVATVNAMPGSTVDVTVAVGNNTGISALAFNVTYGNDLRLTDIRFNSALGGGTGLSPEPYSSPVSVQWVNAFSPWTGDGTFVTLTFQVSDKTPLGTRADITLSYDPENIYVTHGTIDTNVPITLTNGAVDVNPVPGDINGDGNVNSKDITRLFQYQSNWDVYVNEHTVDVNGDGKVNSKDITRLFQYQANWNVEIFINTFEVHTHSYSEWEYFNLYTHKCDCSCGDIQVEEHHWNNGEVTVRATETVEGQVTFTCTACGGTMTESIGFAQHEHTYEEAWTFDDSYHWHAMSCGCDAEENREDFLADIAGLTEEEVLAIVCRDYGAHEIDPMTHRCQCGFTETATLTFVDERGMVLSTVVEEYGKTVSLDLQPQKPNKAFVEWQRNGKTVTEYTVTGDAKFVAVFVNTYLAVFVGDQNEVIDVQEIAAGGNAAIPDTIPTKIGNRFVGWENNSSDITEDTVIHALFEPISFTLTVIYPDGTPVQAAKTVSYGIYPDNLIKTEPYWLNPGTNLLYSFTGLRWNGDMEWTFAKIEAAVWEQYQTEPSATPTVTIEAIYSQKYLLPYLLIEKTGLYNGELSANLNIVLPRENTNLYAVDLTLACGKLTFTGDNLNKSSEIYKHSGMDGQEAIVHQYRSKANCLDFEWVQVTTDPVTFVGSENIDRLTFDTQGSGIEEITLVESSYLLIGSAEKPDELTKITPIVIYRK